ncbi:MAG: NAD(P)-dependent oxidoreductase [SAR202 cluster bacterium]|nr:NAD(P)-dependent oxidoreductase [SAR202 cluster bacterium]
MPHANVGKSGQLFNRIGFIGIGRMGLPMARSLLSAGFHLTVHNRTPAKAQSIVSLGATPASSPTDIARACDAVLACLPDVPASESVFLGPDGLIANARPGQLFIDFSTVGPTTSRRIYNAAKAKGARFLDAPVSGGVERAASASLTIMAGGDRDAFDRALPIFNTLGSTVRYVGPSGAGSVVKLINQLLVGVHTLAAAEALVLGAKADADPKQLLEILKVSWGQSFMLDRNGPIMLERRYDDARGPLRLLLKDMSLVNQMGRDSGVPLRAASQALEAFRQAADQGMSELDLSALGLLLEKEAGIRIADLSS